MKKVAAWIFLVAILVLFQVVGDAPNVFAQSKPRNGWEQSFKAGMIDGATGKPIRCTEIVHLVAHTNKNCCKRHGFTLMLVSNSIFCSLCTLKPCWSMD